MLTVQTVRSGATGLALALDCPLCGCAPADPVRVDGQSVCRSCAGTCPVCQGACVPGDDVCGECNRLVVMAGQAVPA